MYAMSNGAKTGFGNSEGNEWHLKLPVVSVLFRSCMSVVVTSICEVNKHFSWNTMLVSYGTKLCNTLILVLE